MASRPPAGSAHLSTLDLLRFACALLVVAHHIGTVYPLADGGFATAFGRSIVLPAGGAAWTWFGWIGVEIFFTISGYVIAQSAVGTAPATFVRRRVLRLAPAAWICASLTAAVLAFAGTVPFTTLAARWTTALLFVPTAMPIDSCYWTLQVETVFYALVAAALHLGRGDPRTIARVGGLLGITSGAALIGARIAGLHHGTMLDTMPMNLSLLPHGVFFALGMLMRQAHAARWSPARAIAAVALFGAGLIEIAMRTERFAGLPGVTISPLLPSLAFAAGVAALALAPALQPWFVRRRVVPGLVTLGATTYPLYLVHQTCGKATVLALTGAGMPGGAAMVVTGAAMIALAFAIAAWGEPRLRAALADAIAHYVSRRRVPRRDTPPIASLPAG